MNAPVTDLPALGGSLALSLVSLGAVCLLAYVVLRWLGRQGVGRGAGPLKVIARCALEPKRSVYIVEAAGRYFLMGVGDGPMTLLSELDSDAVQRELLLAPAGGRPATAWAATLARVLKPGPRQSL